MNILNMLLRRDRCGNFSESGQLNCENEAGQLDKLASEASWFLSEEEGCLSLLSLDRERHLLFPVMLAEKKVTGGMEK